MDVDFANIKIHANRFCRVLGNVIQADKTKYTQTGSVVVLVMSYSRAKQSTFCGLWSILVVPDVEYWNNHYAIITMIAYRSSGIVKKVPNTEEQMISLTSPQHFSSPAGPVFIQVFSSSTASAGLDTHV